MKRRILMVDDSRLEADLIAAALKSVSDAMVLELIQDAEEALDLLASGDVPDVLLVDLRMPTMDGFEFLAALPDRVKGTAAVIAFSSSSDPDDARRAHDSGAAAFLTKPDTISGYAELARRLADPRTGMVRRMTPSRADARTTAAGTFHRHHAGG